MDLVNLPDLVILRIIGLLDVDDILNLSKVHERFSELADSDHIWFNRCWNAISPFWAFVELPNKSDSESYMEYFMRCISKNSTQLKEVVFDFSELKIGDETWKRIDDYQFKNDVWKHAHWSGDVSMGSQTDSECDHYLHDILCFKRNGENKESITKLPGTMRDDLFRLSQVYGLPHETHRQSKVIGLEPHATIPSNGRFMDIFEDLPIFSEVMTTYYEQHKTFIFFMLITEFLEPIFKDLVERNVFSIHEVNGLLSFIIERSLLEITEGNLGMLYADEDSYHKFGKKFAKYELGYSKSHKYFDFKILKDLFSYLETLLISVLMEHDDNLNVTGLVEKREKFINMKLSEFYEVADRGFLYDTFSFFINLYKMNKYEDGSSKLIDKIENLLFHSTEIEGKEDCVRAYFLTDYLVVNGKDREHLEAVRLLMNIVAENIFRNNLQVEFVFIAASFIGIKRELKVHSDGQWQWQEWVAVAVAEHSFQMQDESSLESNLPVQHRRDLSGIFLSHMIPDISLNFNHAAFTLAFTSWLTHTFKIKISDFFRYFQKSSQARSVSYISNRLQMLCIASNAAPRHYHHNQQYIVAKVQHYHELSLTLYFTCNINVLAAWCAVKMLHRVSLLECHLCINDS
ncbi:hypothetical protein GQR58_008792 [Nymphon striatum]|nr:hypothetical protein GQR58_008792 [Nymphon striatum]